MRIINLNEYDKVPKEQGIYFIFSENELLYIGRSNNLFTRIKKHIHPSYIEQAFVNPKEIKSIMYILEKNSEECKYTEQNLIDDLKPKHNGELNWWCNRHRKELPTKEQIAKINSVNL